MHGPENPYSQESEQDAADPREVAGVMKARFFPLDRESDPQGAINFIDENKHRWGRAAAIAVIDALGGAFPEYFHDELHAIRQECAPARPASRVTEEVRPAPAGIPLRCAAITGREASRPASVTKERQSPKELLFSNLADRLPDSPDYFIQGVRDARKDGKFSLSDVRKSDLVMKKVSGYLLACIAMGTGLGHFKSKFHAFVEEGIITPSDCATPAFQQAKIKKFMAGTFFFTSDDFISRAEAMMKDEDMQLTAGDMALSPAIREWLEERLASCYASAGTEFKDLSAWLAQRGIMDQAAIDRIVGT